jgi:small ligand-binding sensory domain FIST
MGQMPVAGSSCAGELGPVGGRNYLHGFTASIAVFPAASFPPKSDPGAPPGSG